MKGSIIVFTALVLSSTSFAQTIISEDFDNGIPSFWTVVDGGTSASSWFGTNGGRGGFGIDYVLGNSEFAMVDSDLFGNGNVLSEQLLTPVFDGTLFGVVILEYDQYYRNFGVDRGYVEVWDGSSWQELREFSSDMGAWGAPDHQIIDLTTYINQSMQVRFRYEDNNAWAWWWAIDNISIYSPPALDARTLNVLSPVSGCPLSNAEPVTVQAFNGGSTTINSLEICYSLNGAAPICETVSTALGFGDTLTYTFTTPADLSAAGAYAFDVFVNLPGDLLQGNDTLLAYTATNTTLTTYPYEQSFDSWAPDNTNPVELPSPWINSETDGPQDWWIFGGTTPSPGTGPPGDHTSGLGHYLYLEDSGFDEDSVAVISPCMDLTGINGAFSYWYHSEDKNGVNQSTMYVEVGDGTSWTRVDTVEHSGSEWQFQEIPLDAYMNSIVQVRFVGNNDNGAFSHDIAIDDFTIREKLTLDVGLFKFNSPTGTSCNFGEEDVCVEIRNFGLSLIPAGLPLQYTAAGDTFFDTVPVNLAPGEAYEFCFSDLLDIPGPGEYEIKVWTALFGDMDLSNDTVSETIAELPIINFYPYIQDFESGNGGWRSGGILNSWEMGLPNKQVINSASSGSNAWVTGGLGTGTYNGNEQSYVVGPCFNFTPLPPNPWISMKVWWNSEPDFDGAVLQYSVDSGMTWIRLGNFGEPHHWYTHDSVHGVPGGQYQGWSGWDVTGQGSGGWVQAKHAIPGSLIGEPHVLFRVAFASNGAFARDGFAFDDILIAGAPTISVGPDTAVCSTEHTIKIGTVLPGTIEWSNGESGDSITVDSSGKYWVTYTNLLGLCVTDTIEVTLLELTELELGPDSMVCDTNYILRGGPGMTYAWSTLETTPEISANATGTYSVTVTTSGGCSDSDMVMLTFLDVSYPELGEDTTLCIPATYTLNGGTAQSHLWSTGATTQSITASATDTYWVEATSTDGCVKSDSVYIVAITSPPAGLDDAIEICDTVYEIIPEYIPGATYAWSTGDTTNSTIVNADGDYSVTVSFDGCGSSR